MDDSVRQLWCWALIQGYQCMLAVALVAGGGAYFGLSCTGKIPVWCVPVPAPV